MIPDPILLGPRAGCYGALELSRLAMGERPMTSLDQAHLDTCDRCRTQMKIEQAMLQEAMHEPLPQSLHQAAQPLRVRSWARPRVFVVSGCALALALALGPFLLTQTPATAIQVKGGFAVYASVLRGDKLLMDEEPLAGMKSAVRPDDRLRLRVSSPGKPWVVLESFDHGAWMVLHRGVLPRDGWLPTGLVITAGPTRLRFTVCVAADMLARCEHHELNL